MSGPILCYGEVLWDALPGGLYLGGAPFNVAVHLHQLGEHTVFASRVGEDHLGEEIVRRMEYRGMRSDFIQVDSTLPTGFVCVALEPTLGPSYTILHPSAWDSVEPTETLRDVAQSARAIIFGSLAQRDERTRSTLRELLEKSQADRVFDVNLRPPYDSREIVEASLRDSTVVKLNGEELRQIGEWFGLPSGERAALRSLADEFGCETVCVTRGDRGASLFHHDEIIDHPGYRVDVADAVGAGDAFLAGLLSQMYSGADPMEALDFANALGAYVATQSGATPVHDQRAIEAIRERRG